MDLTPENKETIDGKSYADLLRHNRFAPVGDPWFQGETGTYWLERMSYLKNQGVDHVGASKSIGWE